VQAAVENAQSPDTIFTSVQLFELQGLIREDKKCRMVLITSTQDRLDDGHAEILIGFLHLQDNSVITVTNVGGEQLITTGNLNKVYRTGNTLQLTFFV